MGHGGERYDALLDHFEPEMTRRAAAPRCSSGCATALVPLVEALARRGPGDPPCSTGGVRPGAAVAVHPRSCSSAMGFDLEAGRQDRSIHPFTGGTHPTDVRLTTRIDPGNPLARALRHACTSSATGSTSRASPRSTTARRWPRRRRWGCTSRSPASGRTWSAAAARSGRTPYPRLQAAFPEALGGVALEASTGRSTGSSRSPIRVEADEVTYNLHIVLRYELEVRLLRDELAVEDLPEAWNAEMERTLGLRPRDDVEGVLQDIHWALGEFGYFPTYALGNLYAASLMRAAERALPSLWDEVARGELGSLRAWLHEHVHRHGARLSAEERVQAVTGHGLTDADFLAYLRAKYGALSGRPLPRACASAEERSTRVVRPAEPPRSPSSGWRALVTCSSRAQRADGPRTPPPSPTAVGLLGLAVPVEVVRRELVEDPPDALPVGTRALLDDALRPPFARGGRRRRRSPD